MFIFLYLSQNNTGDIMKEKILYLGNILLLFVFLFVLVIIPNEVNTSNIKQINEKEATTFLLKEKSTSLTLPVVNDGTKDTQVENISNADFIKYDDNFMYSIINTKLNIVNLGSNELIESIEFNNFYPLELLLSNNQIIVLGSSEQTYNLIQGHKIEYHLTSFAMYFINKSDFIISRFITFDNSFYINAVTKNNYLYLILMNTNIFNNETHTFIYPTFDDSTLGKNQLKSKDLYLNETGNNAYSLLLFAKIDLNNKAKTILKGFLGLAGITKLTSDYLTIACSIYNETSKTDLIIFKIDEFSYAGHIIIDGYLISEYALYTYNNYLRIATSNYINDESKNYIYNISLTTFKVLSSIQIAPKESIYAIRFKDNYCYLTTFLYIDPFYLIDFTNPNKIKITHEEELDFVGDYIKLLDDDTIFMLGRLLKPTGESEGLVLALFNKELKLIKNVKITNPNIYSDVIYNQSAIAFFDKYVAFSAYSDDKQAVYVYDKSDLALLHQFNFEDEFVLRTLFINNKLYIITNSALTSYSLPNYAKINEINFA